ncbi:MULTISPECIES: hypothetical protein [Bacteroidaceae]|uniref:hypothetical protein n=1 Tax=Bacteroidaceae TaxID=815 RepID=UPI0025A96946|nr:hypothetical protein [Bacteroides acidifaciens]
MTLHTRKTWQVPLRHNSYQAARKLIGELREEKVFCKRVMICKKGVQPKEKIQMGIPERWLSCRRHLYWKRMAVQGKKGYRADRFVCHYVKMRIETGKNCLNPHGSSMDFRCAILLCQKVKIVPS